MAEMELVSVLTPDQEAEDEKPLEMPRLEDLDRVFSGGDEPYLMVDGQKLTLRDAVKADMASKPPHHYATRVDVKHLNYEVTIDLKAPIASIGSIFAPRKGEKVQKKIIDDISFSLLPYENTALLGAPRSGKTSLFDLIAQRRTGEGISGEVSVNGHAPGDNYHHLVSYVLQGDEHAGLLTVKETFEFAAWCQMPVDEPKVINSRVDGVIQLLGLQNCKDTPVGDIMHRGVSGGEKRRTTIGIEWVKGPSFFLLDEPTTGLDSGAAMNVARILRIISMRGTPILCALLQPSWELLSLFDKLIILSEGQVAYWGPISDALPYFRSLGYECPAAYSAAEFLAEVVDHPEKFPLDTESGNVRSVTTRQGFIDAWRQSELCKRMMEISQAASSSSSCSLPSVPSSPSSNHVSKGLHPLEKINVKPQLRKEESTKIDLKSDVPQDIYARTRWEQFKLLLWRSYLTQKRDLRTLYINMANMLISAIVMGLIFLNRKNEQIDTQIKFGLIFFVIARCAFNSLAGIPVLYFERPYFYRQRAAKYYAVLPYVANSMVSPLPVLFFDILIFSTIVYWMTGLDREAGKFFFFLAVLFLMATLFVAFARICAAITPSPLFASLLASTLAVLLLLFTGFLINRNRMPKAWSWANWINPLKYGIEATIMNEFIGQKLKCSANELVPPTSVENFSLPYPEGWSGVQYCQFQSGSQFLKSVGIPTSHGTMWGYLFAVLPFLVIWVGLFYLIMLKISYANVRAVGGSVKAHLGDHQSQRGNELVKTKAKAATLSWESLQYTVPIPGGQPRKLLKDIDGYVKPAMLLALMGASGAGKTTLQDVLALRKNLGKVEGEMRINGQPLDKSYPRIIGYVEQFDIMFPFQTVLEAVEFAAESRLPNYITKDERNEIIERVLDLLNLRSTAGSLVGWGGTGGGINPEERKRLSIAIELVSEPSILFLDEPTSGLDSDGADRVMGAIAKIALSGTAVVCTIHQPSTRIFARASHLLLLKRGGEMVYFGELGKNFEAMLSYFDSLGLQCPQGMNPADFVLEVSLGNHNSFLKNRNNSESVAATEMNLSALWKDSSNNRQLQDELKGIRSEPAPAVDPKLAEALKRPYALGWGRQFVLSSKRWATGIWRAPMDFLIIVFRALVLSLVLGTLFWNRPNDDRGAGERVGLLFFSAVFSFLTAFAYMPGIFMQRLVYYRERAERMYRASPYAISRALFDIPTLTIGILIFGAILYWMAGLNPDVGRFFFFMLCLLLFGYMALAFSQFLAAAFAAPDTAGLVFSATLSTFSMAAGFLIPRNEIPVFMRWAYWISFSRYLLEAVTVNELAGLKLHCENGGIAIPIPFNGTTVEKRYCAHTSGDDFLRAAGMNTSLKWPDVGALIGFWLIFLTGFTISLRYLVHMKR